MTPESTFGHDYSDPDLPERLARMRRLLAPYHAAARVLAERDPAAARQANADALSAILDDLSPEAAQRARRTILHLRELARTGRDAEKQARDDQIVRLAASGMTQREIAKEMGVGQATVSAVVDDRKRNSSESDHWA